MSTGQFAKLFQIILLVALTAILAFAGFYAAAATFQPYDDVGYLMLTQKMFFAGHPLYDQTFSQYGPAYYAYKQLLLIISRLPLSHDSTIIFSVFARVASALLCAGYVARTGRNVFLTAFAFLGVFVLLNRLRNEPGHPQELCALLLSGMIFASSFISSVRRGRVFSLGLIGFLIGLLAMTKTNLGVFAAIAASLCCANWLASRRSRTILFRVSAVLAVVLPLALMRHRLGAVGGYCFLETAAILLLIMQLALSEVERTLPVRELWVPVATVGAAVLACAGYTLATGTSLAGFIHGIFLQHINFDRSFFVPPPFTLGDVIGPAVAGFVLLLWVRRGVPMEYRWAATVLKFSVAPLMVLLGALRPLHGAATLVWCLPLAAATAFPAERQSRTLSELLPRHFAVSLAVLSALWGYPVWGTQSWLSTFLLLPVVLVSCADAIRYGNWGDRSTSAAKPESEIESRSSPARQKFGWGIICSAAAIGVVIGALLLTYTNAKVYRAGEPLDFPGAQLMRMPPGQAALYRELTRAASSHGKTFYSMPGLGSLYFWTGREPPTCLNATHWMTVLTPKQQERLVQDLQRTPELCVIRWNELVAFYTKGEDISRNKGVRYIEENFVTVENVGRYEIMVRKPGAQ